MCFSLDMLPRNIAIRVGVLQLVAVHFSQRGFKSLSRLVKMIALVDLPILNLLSGRFHASAS